MLATFALLVIASALSETSEQGKSNAVVMTPKTERLSRTISRFQVLWEDWVEASRIQFRNRQHPELDKLFSRTARVMADSAIVISDIKMKIPVDGQVKISSSRLLKILKNARKAIRSGQRISHLEELQSRARPVKFAPGIASDVSRKNHERKKRLSDKADTLVERRKKPVQCCMFVALAFYQFLHGDEVHDFVAEYEDEVVRETFSSSILVDDAKTYEQLQLKNHFRARPRPPKEGVQMCGLSARRTAYVPHTVPTPGPAEGLLSQTDSSRTVSSFSGNWLDGNPR
ncbi:hypothetical protein G7046_g4665 [Stylonectria norvegica]|nr:hypothetical protein G7046_g4665 [Stylonectria norvegica]